MLKQAFCAGVLTLVVLNLAPASLAIAVQQVPNPRRTNGGWVSDTANMLSVETELTLNQMISALEARNGSEIAVVTVPDTAPSANPKSFATSLFNYWKIGKQGQNNGVLFLISKGDRRVEIETGRGLAARLPNSRVNSILEQEVTPQFKQRQFDAGTLAGTRALIDALDSDNPTNDAFPATSALTSQPGVQRQPDAIAPSSTAQIPSTQARSSNATLANGLVSVAAGVGAGSLSVAGILLYRRRRRILLEPEADSRVETKQAAQRSRERLHCAVCKKPMDLLHEFELSPYLSQAQQVAQQLGSVAYDGWRCLSCQSSLYGRGFHLRAYELDTEQFSHCSTCQELTATQQSQILKQPTWNEAGTRLFRNDCQCCKRHWETEAGIPRVPLPKDAVTISPIGNSRVQNARFFQQDAIACPTHCSTCHYPMEQVNPNLVQRRLRQPEQVAQELGSVAFIGWQCPHCNPDEIAANIHVRSYILSSHYHTCPHCQELTVERTSEVTISATSNREGRRRNTDSCYCCSFVNESWESIPRLPSTSSSSSSSSSSWSSDSSSSSSSSSSSDFGGGSSDSGGSGSSWSSDSGSSSSSSDFGGGSSDSGGSGSSW